MKQKRLHPNIERGAVVVLLTGLLLVCLSPSCLAGYPPPVPAPVDLDGDGDSGYWIGLPEGREDLSPMETHGLSSSQVGAPVPEVTHPARARTEAIQAAPRGHREVPWTWLFMLSSWVSARL